MDATIVRTGCAEGIGGLPYRGSYEEYFNEHGLELGFYPDTAAKERVYQFFIEAARVNLQQGLILQRLASALADATRSYAGGNTALLFTGQSAVDFTINAKPFASVMSKVYRVNGIHNKQYPEPPRGGLVNYANLYERLNDLLRTRIVCRYLDGPRFVAGYIERFCQQESLGFNSYSMATEMGYHAWHCYISLPLEIVEAGDVKTVPVKLEIQLTTQLAEVIGSLTHGLYEGAREMPQAKRDDGWRWEPKSQEFRSAYLGHALHLLEGVIQTFKDDVLGPAGESTIDEPSSSPLEAISVDKVEVSSNGR